MATTVQDGVSPVITKTGKVRGGDMINEAFGQKKRLRPMRGSFWLKQAKTLIWDLTRSLISIWET